MKAISKILITSLFAVILGVQAAEKPTTSLDQAVQDGDVEAIKSLVAQSADVNHQVSALKLTPLQIAACSGDSAVLSCLLELKADSCVLDCNGNSILMLAILAKEQQFHSVESKYWEKVEANFTQCYRMLSSRFPDLVTQANVAGTTPLELAIQFHDGPVAAILRGVGVEAGANERKAIAEKELSLQMFKQYLFPESGSRATPQSEDYHSGSGSYSDSSDYSDN